MGGWRGSGKPWRGGEGSGALVRDEGVQVSLSRGVEGSGKLRRGVGGSGVLRRYGGGSGAQTRYGGA